GNSLDRHWPRLLLYRADLAEHAARVRSHAVVHPSGDLVDGSRVRQAGLGTTLTRRRQTARSLEPRSWLGVTRWLLLFVVASHPVAAQFVVRSWLPWRTIETPHFAFHYPLELEPWTRAVATRIE